VSWPAILVVVAAVAVIAFSGYLLASWPPEPPAPPPAASQGRANAPATSGTVEDEEEKPVLVVLGDSFSARSPASAGPEWPQILAERLDWEVVREVVDGSGYVSAGDGEPFGGRVEALLDHEPDVVIVAGGVGDVGAYPTQRIANAAEDVVTDLVEAQGPQVVLVSPFSNGEPGPLTSEFAAELRQIADDQRIPYVNGTSWLADGENYFGSDSDHPNDRGQGVIADEMERVLETLRITDGQQSEE
jgi:lysophospholipase L1-like esterase